MANTQELDKSFANIATFKGVLSSSLIEGLTKDTDRVKTRWNNIMNDASEEQKKVILLSKLGNDGKDTVLHKSITSSNFKMIFDNTIKILTELGDKEVVKEVFTARDYFYDTPLMMAIGARKIETVKSLLQFLKGQDDEILDSVLSIKGANNVNAVSMIYSSRDADLIEEMHSNVPHNVIAKIIFDNKASIDAALNVVGTLKKDVIKSVLQSKFKKQDGNETSLISEFVSGEFSKGKYAKKAQELFNKLSDTEIEELIDPIFPDLIGKTKTKTQTIDSSKRAFTLQEKYVNIKIKKLQTKNSLVDDKELIKNLISIDDASAELKALQEKLETEQNMVLATQLSEITGKVAGTISDEDIKELRKKLEGFLEKGAIINEVNTKTISAIRSSLDEKEQDINDASSLEKVEQEIESLKIDVSDGDTEELNTLADYKSKIQSIATKNARLDTSKYTTLIGDKTSKIEKLMSEQNKKTENLENFKSVVPFLAYGVVYTKLAEEISDFYTTNKDSADIELSSDEFKFTQYLSIKFDYKDVTGDSLCNNNHDAHGDMKYEVALCEGLSSDPWTSDVISWIKGAIPESSDLRHELIKTEVVSRYLEKVKEKMSNIQSTDALKAVIEDFCTSADDGTKQNDVYSVVCNDNGHYNVALDEFLPKLIGHHTDSADPEL